MSRKWQQTRPARVALIGLATYVAAMLAITGIGRSQVSSQLSTYRFMLGPVPVTPWARALIVDRGIEYQLGEWSLFGGLKLGARHAKGDLGQDREAVIMARAHPEARPFLRWSRFPVYRVTRDGPATVVHMEDMRYPGASWASATVRLD